MEKGKLLRFAEEVSEHARSPKEFESLDEYREYEIGWLTLRLLGRLSRAAAKGRKRTDVEIAGNGLEPGQEFEARLVMAAVNQTVQDNEEFQTVVEYSQNGTSFTYKLIMFWSDGLSEYHNEIQRLDEDDRPHLIELGPTETDREQVPFRLHIVDSES